MNCLKLYSLLITTAQRRQRGWRRSCHSFDIITKCCILVVCRRTFLVIIQRGPVLHKQCSICANVLFHSQEDYSWSGMQMHTCWCSANLGHGGSISFAELFYAYNSDKWLSQSMYYSSKILWENVELHFNLQDFKGFLLRLLRTQQENEQQHSFLWGIAICHYLQLGSCVLAVLVYALLWIQQLWSDSINSSKWMGDVRTKICDLGRKKIKWKSKVSPAVWLSLLLFI